VLSSPAVNEAIELLWAGKTVPKETYAHSLVPIERDKLKNGEVMSRRAAEGLITILVARMLEANDPHVLAITSEKKNGGPYVKTSRPQAGLVEVSFVSNFTHLEDKEREISILLTILGWRPQPLPSSPVIVYSKAWSDSVPASEIGSYVATALVYVINVARMLPSWFYTTVNNDSLIEELANSLPIWRFESDETHARSDIARAFADGDTLEKIRRDAPNSRRPPENLVRFFATSSNSPFSDQIADIYLHNLETKLFRRGMQHMLQRMAIDELLSMFPQHRL
jgi:hypothetical protein